MYGSNEVGGEPYCDYTHLYSFYFETVTPWDKDVDSTDLLDVFGWPMIGELCDTVN